MCFLRDRSAASGATKHPKTKFLGLVGASYTRVDSTKTWASPKSAGYWRQMGFLLGNQRKSLMNVVLFDTFQALASGRSSWDSAPGAGGCLSLGLLCGDCCSLRASPVLSMSVSARGKVVPRVLEAQDPVPGKRSCRRLGCGPGPSSVTSSPVPCRTRRARRYEGGSVAGGRAGFLVITAGGRFGPPEASRQFAERGWTGMARGSRLVTGACAGQVVRSTELACAAAAAL